MKSTIEYFDADYSDAGKKRNDDSRLRRSFEIENGVFRIICVADGVGGLGNGHLASGFICDQLDVWFEENKEKLAGAEVTDATMLLYDKVLEIHDALLTINEEKDMTAGSTLTVALLYKRNYLVLQVGDSRAYLCDEEGCRQLTKDQTQAQMERDRGLMAPDEVDDRKEKTILQAIGQATVVPEIYEGSLPGTYYFLICSDGLSNTITEEEMKEELFREARPKEKIIHLTDLARNRGETDNITAVLAGRKVIPC